MTPIIGTNTNALSNVASSIGTTRSALTSQGTDVPTLPPPSDPLLDMTLGSDPGSAIAALVMLTQKELRKAARTERDMAYEQQERAQTEELEHMQSAASTRLATGLLDGGLKLGSAGFSIAAATTQLRAAQNTAKIDDLARVPSSSQSMADMANIDRMRRVRDTIQLDGIHLDGLAKGLEGAGGISKSVGEFLASADDRGAKAAQNRATTFNRLAEGRGDDARDADKSIDRAIEFLQQWLSGKAATMQAAASFRA